jgi:hypothetical protein
MAHLPIRDTARPLTTLGDVEPVIHMLCGTDFRLSLSAGIEHMFAQESAKRRCSFPGCGRPHLAKGLCRGHYEQQRAKRALQPLPSRPRGDPACSFVGCENVAVKQRTLPSSLATATAEATPYASPRKNWPDLEAGVRSYLRTNPSERPQGRLRR